MTSFALRALRSTLKRPFPNPTRGPGIGVSRNSPGSTHACQGNFICSTPRASVSADESGKRGPSRHTSRGGPPSPGDNAKSEEHVGPQVPVSMEHKDKPDFIDLADLVLSGGSYDEVVKGTEFDTMDEETRESYDEVSRRISAFRDNELDAYLEEHGEHELVDELHATEERRVEAIRKLEKSDVESDETVGLAQGDWSEILVQTDRVHKTIKGGMVVSYRALVCVGNLQGLGGFAVGKSSSPAQAVVIASRKAKMLRNLIYVDRYKQTSLVHDVVGKHNSCKAYIWARPPGYGMRASGIVRDILYNIGITDAGAKLVGNRNRYSMVRAIFNALSQHEGIQTTAMKRGKRILSLQSVRARN